MTGKKKIQALCVIILTAALIHYSYVYWNWYKEDAQEQQEIMRLLDAFNQMEDDTGGMKNELNRINNGLHSFNSDESENMVQSDDSGALNNASIMNNHQNRNQSAHNYSIHSDSDTKSIDNKKKDTPQLPAGADCIISIPDINLEKIVYTGSSREERLDEYNLITATSDMKYSNGGNYIICGHASRLYGHSLNRLKEIKPGDKVKIQSNSESEEYVVKSVDYEVMNDTSSYCEQTKEPTITIISCAKYIAKNKYIVIKCVKRS